MCVDIYRKNVKCPKIVVTITISNAQTKNELDSPVLFCYVGEQLMRNLK